MIDIIDIIDIIIFNIYIGSKGLPIGLLQTHSLFHATLEIDMKSLLIETHNLSLIDYLPTGIKRKGRFYFTLTTSNDHKMKL